MSEGKDITKLLEPEDSKYKVFVVDRIIPEQGIGDKHVMPLDAVPLHEKQKRSVR